MFRFYDSFGHYNQALINLKWDVYAPPDGTTAASITQATNIGRFGSGGCLFAVSNNNNTSGRVPSTQVQQYLQKNYSSQSIVHVNLAIKQEATQLTRGSRLLTFVDGSTTQLGIDIMPSGQIRLVRGDLGTGIHLVSSDPMPGQSALYTVLGTTTNAIFSNAFDYLQFKVTHGTGSSGSVEIRRGDGSAFETISSINTAPSGTASSASCLLGGYAALIGAGGGTVENHYLRATISDFLLYDTVVNGSDALDLVTFCGDRHGERITLTADGFYAESTPSTGSTRFDLIEEVPPNTSDYNTLGAVGIQDSFVVGAVPGVSATTLFVVATMYLQKTGGGVNEMKMLYRLAGADRLGTAFQVPSPWAFKQSALFSKPGGGAITVADVQPATGQVGYEKTA